MIIDFMKSVAREQALMAGAKPEVKSLESFVIDAIQDDRGEKCNDYEYHDCKKTDVPYGDTHVTAFNEPTDASIERFCNMYADSFEEDRLEFIFEEIINHDDFENVFKAFIMSKLNKIDE